MESTKYKIEHNTVQETLVIPLYARKRCSELYPEYFQDPATLKLISKLDYQFDALEEQANGIVQSFGALEVAMRQRNLQIEIKEYLQTHPQAAVINLGCGLDQTAEYCDNGQCTMYNVDFPDVIEIRNALIDPRERVIQVPTDINDYRWFDAIDDSHGSIFVAAGVFYYFTMEDALNLFKAMENRFTDGVLVFDAANKFALKLMLKTWIKQAGIQDLGAYFHIKDAAKDLGPILLKSQVTSRPYMYGYCDLKSPSVKGSYRTLAHIGDHFMHMQMARLHFQPQEK